MTVCLEFQDSRNAGHSVEVSINIFFLNLFSQVDVLTEPSVSSPESEALLLQSEPRSFRDNSEPRSFLSWSEESRPFVRKAELFEPGCGNDWKQHFGTETCGGADIWKKITVTIRILDGWNTWLFLLRILSCYIWILDKIVPPYPPNKNDRQNLGIQIMTWTKHTQNDLTFTLPILN